jgi:carbon starvation protein
MVGAFIPKFAEKRWIPGIIITSAVFTFFWGYLVYTGNISTIWPLFGMSNQLLASSALIIGTTMIMRMNKVKYAWITAVPGVLMAFITMYAGYLNVVDNYLPKHLYLLMVMSIIIEVLMVIVFVGAIKKWFELLKVKTTVVDEYGEKVLEIVPE